MTRRVASVTTILALTAAFPAFAADLPFKVPAAAPAQFSWTGCYVGGHVGGIVSEDRTTSVFGGSRSFSASGVAGGGQIGCDYQFAPNWVAGVEGRVAGANLKNSHPASVTSFVTGITVPSQFSLNNDFLASTTARLGYSFADRWLVFVRGGGAWTREKIDDAFTSSVTGLAVDPSASLIRTGWTAGAGVDWALAPNWSATLEYDYYDFGSSGALLTNGSNVSVSIFSLKDTIHTVTLGVNYHF